MTDHHLNRLYRLREVEQFAGLKRTQIAELIKAGEFPKPIPLSDSGRAVAWLEHELIAWQTARIATREGKGR
jgi:prophage regulatory protein